MRRTGVFYDHVFDGRSPEPSVNKDNTIWDGRESNLHSGVPGSPDLYRIVLPCLHFYCARLPTDPDLSLPFPTAPLENVRIRIALLKAAPNRV